MCGAFSKPLCSIVVSLANTLQAIHWSEVPPAHGMADLANDIIVVGAGSGGSHAAAALACSGYRVLLIEAGSRVPQDLSASIWVHPKYGATNKRRWWEWRTHPAGFSIFGGRGEGGSSAVNGMIYNRGHHRDFPVPWSDIEAAHAELEPPDLTAGMDASSLPPIVQDVITAFHSVNLPWLGMHGLNQTRNGFGFMPRWRKRKTAFQEAFEKSCPTSQEGEVRVLWNTKVLRLLWSSGTAIPRVESIELFHSDNSTTIVATRHVVVAAGAIATPLLLLASEAERLCHNGIGFGLQDHIGFDVIFRFKTKSGCEEPLPTLVAFVGGDRPIHEIVLEPYCCSAADLEEHVCIRATVILLRGMTRGGVRLLKVASRGRISSLIRYAVEMADITELGIAMHFVRSFIFGSQYLVEYDPAPLPIGRFPKENDFPGLYHHLKPRLRNFHHPAGTMSNSIDSRLRLKGCHGVTIADSSVLVSPSTGHPDVSVRLLGRVAARYISESGWPAWPGWWRTTVSST